MTNWRSWNMRPDFTESNTANRSLVHTELSRDILLRFSGCANGAHIVLGQFSASMLCAARCAFRLCVLSVPIASGCAFGMHSVWMRVTAKRKYLQRGAMLIPASLPASFYLIAHVILVRSGAEMGRIAAWAIVAGMQDMETVGDRTIPNLPSRARGDNHLPSPPQYAITSAANRLRPFPARIRCANGDARPKAIAEIVRKAMILGCHVGTSNVLVEQNALDLPGSARSPFVAPNVMNGKRLTYAIA